MGTPLDKTGIFVRARADEINAPIANVNKDGNVNENLNNHDNDNDNVRFRPTAVHKHKKVAR